MQQTRAFCRPLGVQQSSAALDLRDTNRTAPG